jgi:hypothetical protein
MIKLGYLQSGGSTLAIIDSCAYDIVNHGRIPMDATSGIFDYEPDRNYVYYLSPEEVIRKNSVPDLNDIEEDLVGLCEDNEVMKEAIRNYFKENF